MDKLFLDYKGYKVKETIIYQEIKSAIILDKNCKKSSYMKTKKTNIGYFFINDRIKQVELEVKQCTTEDMIADYFTKSLQEKIFIKFHKYIVNLKF